MVKNFGQGPEPNRYISITRFEKKINNKWITIKVKTNGESETQYRNNTDPTLVSMAFPKDKFSRSFGNLYGKRCVIETTFTYKKGKERIQTSYFELKDAREILKNIRRPRV